MHPATDRRRALSHAEALARQGRRSEALDRYASLLRDAPDDWSVAHLTADLLQLADRQDEAVTIYLGMARHWTLVGEVACAADVYERVLRIAPGDRTALVRLAELAMGRGDEKGARALLSRLRAGQMPGDALIPGDPLASLLAGRADEARSALVRTAVHERGIRPELAEAWRAGASAGNDDGAALAIALADVCLLAGDVAESLAVLRAVLSAAPRHAGILGQFIELAVETGAGGEALQAQAELVDAYLEQGMPERAVPVAEDLASRCPGATNAARLSRLRGATDAELPAGLQAVATSDVPVPVERVRDLSAALDGLERPAGEAEARVACTRGLELERAGRLDEAEVLLRRAAGAPAQRCAAAWGLARAFRRRGRAGEAIAWLEHASEAEPPSPEVGRSVLLDLAALLEAEGEVRRALAVLVAVQSGDDPPADVAERIHRLSGPQEPR